MKPTIWRTRVTCWWRRHAIWAQAVRVVGAAAGGFPRLEARCLRCGAWVAVPDGLSPNQPGRRVRAVWHLDEFLPLLEARRVGPILRLEARGA